MKKQKFISPISVTNDYFKNIDLSSKRKEIIDFLKKINRLELQNESSLWESRYWGKGVGAFQIEGKYCYKNKKIPAITKIQGPKPIISEAEIINYLKKYQTSKIKFPNVLFYQPWNKKINCEIIVFKKNKADFIINPHTLATENQVNEFFQAYNFYKNLLLEKIKPLWQLPKKSPDYFGIFNKWRKIRLENPLHSLISKDEDNLLLHIAKKLNTVLLKIPLEFQHCHLSIYDIKKFKNSYFLFSNLFWGYKWPLYDVVFGFMWYILGISHYSEKEILNQIELWENVIKKTVLTNSKIVKKYNNKTLFYLNIAFLERYLAALNLDVLMTNNKDNILKMKRILINKIKNLSLLLI